MTSREHARRLMLILLSSQGGSESGAGRTDEAGERNDDRQIGEASDDSPETDERRTTALVEALVLT
ncbi:MAG TPA: hypothetical protein VE269_01855 [Gaiellaceae bacterium]|nr:hypothetical protein [Gaiellaceae bacterium]